MNTRHTFRWFWLTRSALKRQSQLLLSPTICALALCAQLASPLSISAGSVGVPQQTAGSKAASKPEVVVANGLQTVKFDTGNGRVIVNLPDDMRAGDTISGTVVAEPKGQTAEERAKSMGVLNGCVIELEPPKKPDGTSNPKVKAQVTAAPSPFTFKLPPSSTLTPPRTNVSSANSAGLGITLTNTSGSLSTGGTTTIPIEMVSLSLQSVAPLNITFQLPTIGQQGRPIEIFGPFDGNSSNTILNWTAVRRQVQDFEKNTENVSGGFGLIAESPRKCVFESPTNATGPVEIVLKEGKQETRGTYRNVGVNLTAPKTNLLKGESTTLKIEVNGLQGIAEPVPLTLESHGVITIEGGMYQPLVIKPSQVGADGRYSTTRGITGVQTGAWGATATVVTHKFDVCLQDDSSPQTVIQWNSFTGDYIFTPSGGTSLSGQGTVTRNGCTITLTDSPPDRRVQGHIDPCAKTGSASVQLVSPRVKFTITDRNTTNNTCACEGCSTTPQQGTNPPPTKPSDQPGAAPSGQPSPTTTPQPDASPTPQPGTTPSKPKGQGPGAMTDDECVDLANEVEQLKDEIKKKQAELDGLPAEIHATEEELKTCESELKQAQDAAENARKDLQKKKSLLDTAKRNNDPRAGGYEQDYKDAKTAKDEADKKVADAKKKRKDLKKKLEDLGNKEKSLPGEIEELKRKLGEKEKALSEWKAAEQKKKQEEAEKKRQEEEKKRQTEAEKATEKTRAEAETERIKYLLANIKSLGLISSDDFWKNEPEKNNKLIELLKKPISDLVEETGKTPIPLDTLEAIKGLYGVAAALLDPCTPDGKRKTVERLQNRVNPKTGNKYTLDEALDKTEGMCELLQKLKALASRK